LLQHFAAVFPQQNSRKLSPQQIAAQFGHQVLIEPVVAGQNQWSLNNFDHSVCVANYDIFQCDEPAGWSDQAAETAASHLTTIATLRQALGVDPTTIDWLHASARTRAYGRGSGGSVAAPEMTATFGALGADDSYFLIRNPVAGSSYNGVSRWWTDSAIGVSFLNDVVYVKTFITNARLDMDAVPPKDIRRGMPRFQSDNYPANVALAEGFAAIAAEHGVYVVYAGLAGFEGGKGMTGSSCVVDPRGKVVVRASATQAQIVRADLDPRSIDLARAELPLLGDLETVLPDLLADEELSLRRLENGHDAAGR